MRTMLTFASLLIVLAVIAVSMRSQLNASKRVLAPAGASDAASGALTGSPQNQVSQYQRQLDAAMKASAQHTADQAASATEDDAR